MENSKRNIIIVTGIGLIVLFTISIFYFFFLREAAIPVKTEEGAMPLSTSPEYQETLYSQIPNLREIRQIVGEYAGEIVGINVTDITKEEIWAKVFFEVEDEDPNAEWTYEEIYCFYKKGIWNEVDKKDVPENIKLSLDKNEPMVTIPKE